MRPGRRQDGVERRFRRIGDARESAVVIAEPIRGQNAGAAAVGQDGQPVADDARVPRQDLGGAEQIVELAHAQHAGAPECGLIGRIRARQRPRVRQRGLGAGSAAPRLHDDDRLCPRGPPCRRHELRRVGDGFHVEQDGAARSVRGEIVQEIAEVGVRHVAQRHDVREADAAPPRPIDDRRDQGTRLGEKRKVAGQRRPMREAGVEADARQHQAETVGALDAQQMRTRRFQHGAPQLVANARRDHDRGARPPCPKLRNECGERSGRRDDDGQIRCSRERGNGRVAVAALDGAVLRVDEPNRPGKSTRQQIARGDQPDAAGPRAGTDQRHRARPQQELEITDGHGVSPLHLEQDRFRLNHFASVAAEA